MSESNFTPISGKGSNKKKSSSNLKFFGLISLLVMFIGVVAGYVMISQGFIFRPKAESRGGNLAKYGWNGTCFTKFSGSGITTGLNPFIYKDGIDHKAGIDHAARYQCAGKITTYSSTGCQKSNGSRTGKWDYNLIPLTINGVSQVCMDPTGNAGPKDANGCFTQQLDLDDGSGGGPEAFYSYDDCKPNPTTTPKPTATPGPSASPTPTPSNGPTPTATPTPPPGSTPTPVPSATPTPTPPACVNPGTPANVHINCPLCN